MMSTHDHSILAPLPRDGDVLQTSRGSKQVGSISDLDDDSATLITCDSETSFSTIPPPPHKTSDTFLDENEGTTFNCALDDFCVCITVHDLSDDVAEKDDSNHSPMIHAEHVKEAELEADKETEIEAETMAPKSDSSKNGMVNSPPIDTEAARQDHASFAFLDMCADLAFIDLCAGVNAGFDLLDQGADQCLSCFGLDDRCGAPPGQEEKTLEAEPTGAATAGQEEAKLAAEPTDVATILDENDKDIDVEELKKCIDCILEEESGTWKKKARNEIKTSSRDKGKTSIIRNVRKKFTRKTTSSTVHG